MAPSHGSRLEDVCNLGVDGLVVASSWAVGSVPWCSVIVNHLSVGELTRQEERKPLIKHNVLIGGNGELAGTVKYKLVFFCYLFMVFIYISCSELPGPILMYTEPQDAHSEEKRVLVTTRVTNSYGREIIIVNTVPQ